MGSNYSHSLEVPGAILHYEVRGEGPLLLLIPGANGDAYIFTALAKHLSTHFKIVTYDRRGYSRSTVKQEQDYSIKRETDADDVARLIKHVNGDEPAYVFGSSSGAIVALTVLARHPNVVRTLMAHEPPLITVLPEHGEMQKEYTVVQEIFDKNGPKAAIDEFVRIVAANNTNPKAMEGMGMGIPGRYTISNFKLWMKHEATSYPSADIDMSVLEQNVNKIVFLMGRESHGILPYVTTQKLAEKFNKPMLDVPGGHVGYKVYPVQFGDELYEGLRKLEQI